MWDAFRATIEFPTSFSTAITPRSIIAKLTSPSLFPIRNRRFTESLAREAVFKEAHLYNTALKDLQGTVVPICFGLWGNTLKLQCPWDVEREIWMMLLEDVGKTAYDELDRKDMSNHVDSDK